VLDRFRRSFSAKVSGLFVLLLLGLGMAIAVLCVRSAIRYMAEADQKLNRTLAAELAPRFEPHLTDGVDHAAVDSVIRSITGVNRRIEIYLLDEEGRVKALLGEPERKLARRRVDLGPIWRFTEGAMLPIMGDDPLDAGGEKPFSVAPAEAMGQTDCYLYIILGSEQFASAADMIANSYILRGTLGSVGLIVLLGSAAGVFLFRRLTRRLRARREVVERLAQGQLDQRVAVESEDEIGRLGIAFNRMADTLAGRLEELRRSDRMRRELIANVSHDLRSPIALIRGYLETLQLKGDAVSAEEREQYLDVALQNAQRLGEHVDALFALSKLDTQQVEPEPEPFSLAELAHDLVMRFQPRAEEQGVRLEVDLPEQLAIVRADIALTERALSNLIGNALHYTPGGGIVRVALEDENDHVRVRVADTGPGIPEDELPRIFERFYRVEKSRSRKGGGAGLGLAIAKKILDLHGSTLDVESTVGEGTTFSFALPA
jgi:signal transduction histidine kinase